MASTGTAQPVLMMAGLKGGTKIMNYSVIKNCDIANGPGVRVSLFVSGCTHHCKGRFQPETWDFNYGQPFTNKTIRQIMDLLSPDHIAGLAVLGGEPMEPRNQRDLLPLIEAVHREYPEKTIWIYTGYTLEELQRRNGENGAVTESVMSLIDVLVDGPFIEEKKQLGLEFRGSANQRLIDMKKTNATGRIMIY